MISIWWCIRYHHFPKHTSITWVWRSSSLRLLSWCSSILRLWSSSSLRLLSKCRESIWCTRLRLRCYQFPKHISIIRGWRSSSLRFLSKCSNRSSSSLGLLSKCSNRCSLRLLKFSSLWMLLKYWGWFIRWNWVCWVWWVSWVCWIMISWVCWLSWHSWVCWLSWHSWTSEVSLRCAELMVEQEIVEARKARWIGARFGFGFDYGNGFDFGSGCECRWDHTGFLI